MADISDQIIISDAYSRLQEEVKRLQLVIAGLTSERDELKFHICPELTARYAEHIGNYENRLHYQEIMIGEMKRRIELAQAALNRERKISREEMDEQVDKEYQEFRDKVNEENDRYEQAKREQREKEAREHRYREAWQKKYGRRYNSDSGMNDGSAGADQQDGSGASQNDAEDSQHDAGGASGESGAGQAGSGCDQQDRKDPNGCNQAEDESSSAQSGDTCTHTGKDNAVPDAKEMYRRIIRKLHPDANPDFSERDKELLDRAIKAYKDGDINTLQEIYDEVFGDDAAATALKDMSYEELTELRDRLLARIEKLKEEIASIKAAFPYKAKEYLDNPDVLERMKTKLNDRIHQNEETLRELSDKLQELMKEMEKLRQGK